MKRQIRFICTILLVTIVLSLFGACGGDNGDSSSKDTQSKVTANEVINTADVSFVDADGEAAYRVIRPQEASDSVTASAAAVFKAIKEKFGVVGGNVDDSEDKKDRAEIVVGDTNRESTKKAKQLLISEATGRGNEYIIATIDKDIVIYGVTEASLKAAVDYFVATYVTGSPVTGGIHYFYTNKEGFKEVKIFGSVSLFGIQIVRPIYNVSYLTQTETDNLAKAVNEITGFNWEITDDQIASKTGNNTDGSGTLTKSLPAEKEIIIGACVRDGVRTFGDDERDVYEIRIEDKKIFLNGGSPAATAMAVSEFAKLIKNNQELTAANSVLNGKYSDTVKGYDSKTTYVRTWGDDFDEVKTEDGSNINYSIWDVGWEAVSSYSGAANGKTQYRGSRALLNNYVKEGCMYQVAVETDTAYYGGYFTTQHMMEYLYGYIELSTVHPKGMGFWTALWSNSDSGTIAEKGPIIDEKRMYFSETDVEECYGPGTWAYGNTFAWPTAYGRKMMQIPENTGIVHVNNVVHSEDDRGFWMDFHTFGFEWIDNTHVRFTCDGYVYADQQLREGAEQIAYSQPVFLRLSLACGSGNHGEPTTDEKEWRETNKFIVDWVHIYQKDGQSMWKTDNRTNCNWTKIR